PNPVVPVDVCLQRCLSRVVLGEDPADLKLTVHPQVHGARREIKPTPLRQGAPRCDEGAPERKRVLVLAAHSVVRDGCREPAFAQDASPYMGGGTPETPR